MSAYTTPHGWLAVQSSDHKRHMVPGFRRWSFIVETIRENREGSENLPRSRHCDRSPILARPERIRLLAEYCTPTDPRVGKGIGWRYRKPGDLPAPRHGNLRRKGGPPCAFAWIRPVLIRGRGFLFYPPHVGASPSASSSCGRPRPGQRPSYCVSSMPTADRQSSA